MTGMPYSPQKNAPGGADEDAYVLPIKDVLQVLWKRLWLIALVMIVLTGVAVGASLTLPPTYEASIKILVGQERGITETPTDVVGLQQLTETMTIFVTTRPVAEETIRRLDLNTTPDVFLEERLEANTLPESQFVEVSYRDSDRQRAREVTNTVGEVFEERISQVSGNANAVTATVVEPAVTPGSPVSPNPLRNGLLALMIGAVLGTGLALLLEFLDDSWRSPEEAEQISGVPTFGVVPEFRVTKAKKTGKEHDDSSEVETPEAGREDQ